MTQRVPDDVVAKFARQQHDWMERVLKGSLDPVEVAQAIQSIINRGKMFNPHTYFKTRQGLYVYKSFKDLILPEVGSMPHRGCEGVTSSVLARNMSDQEVVDEILGGMNELRKHPFTFDQIAAKIDLQPNGEDGELLNNGRTNIFYVLIGEALFAINVYWGSIHCGWNVDNWYLGEDNQWGAGDRVFLNTILTV